MIPDPVSRKKFRIITALIVTLIVSCKVDSQEIVPCCIQDCYGYYPKCLIDRTSDMEMQLVNTSIGLFKDFNTQVRERFVINDNGTKIVCFQDRVRNQNCENEFYSDDSQSTQLSIVEFGGSDAFCLFAAERNVTCTADYSCFCKMGSISNYVDLIVGDSIIPDGQYNVISVGVYLGSGSYNSDTEFTFDLEEGIAKRSLDQTTQTTNEDISKLDHMLQPVYVSMSGASVVVTFSQMNPYSILIRKGDYVQMVTVVKSPTISVIPSDKLHFSEDVIVEVYCHGKIVSTQTMFYTAPSICRYSNCTMCRDAMDNWDCLNIIQQIWLVVCWSAIISCLIIIIKMIVKYDIMSFLFYPCCCFVSGVKRVRGSKFTQDLSNQVGKVSTVKNYFINEAPQVPVVDIESPKMRRKRERAERAIERYRSNLMAEDSSDEDPNDQIVVVSPDSHRYVSGGGRKPSILYTTLLMCIIGTANACTSGTFVTSSSSSCITNSSGYDSCMANYNLFGTIQYSGSSACFTIQNKDNNNNNLTLATVQVTYSYMQLVFSTSTMYYTSDWNLVSQSNKRCAIDTVGNCPSSCSAVNKNQVRDAGGQLNSNGAINYPGTVRCRSSCGCSGCGCFYCSDGCVYSGAGVVPFGNVATVSKISSATYVPVVVVQINDTTGSKSFTMSVTGSCVNSGSYKFCVVGSLIGDPTILGANKVILYNSSYWFASAAEANYPLPGLIGDIQSQSSTNLFTGGVNSFLISSNLYTVSDNGNSDNYLPVRSGMTNFVSISKKIPGLIANGGTWQMSSNNPVLTISNPGALVYTMETTSPVNFVRKVATVCPKVTFLTASGCYSCDRGVTLIVSAFSTCLSGTATFSISANYATITTPAVQLTTVAKNYSLIILTTEKSNSFSLKTEGNGGSSSITVSFTAVSDVAIINNNTVRPNVTYDPQPVNSPGGSSISLAIDDFFSGSGKWWSYLVTVVVFIVAIICIFFAVRVLIVILPPAFSGALQIVRYSVTRKVVQKKDA